MEERRQVMVSRRIRRLWRLPRYVLSPTAYDGPVELEPGTVLEVVSTPKREKA